MDGIPEFHSSIVSKFQLYDEENTLLIYYRMIEHMQLMKVVPSVLAEIKNIMTRKSDSHESLEDFTVNNPKTKSPLYMQRKRNKYPHLKQFTEYFEKTLQRSELSSTRIDMRGISNLNMCCGHHHHEKFSTILKSTITVHSNFSDNETTSIVLNQTISDEDIFEE